MEAIRAAGFAKVAAAMHKLGTVDMPLAQAKTTVPDNPWDAYFEEANEYPETESQYLTTDGIPTVLSRAWHHLLIGLNSDSSGWFPWTPRTRHRCTVLQTSSALSREVLDGFVRKIAANIRKPDVAGKGCVLALNPAPARTTDISLEVEEPLVFVDAEGTRIPSAVSLHDGKWITTARIALPSYGYKLLNLAPTDDVETERWTAGSAVAFTNRRASLSNGRLTLAEGQNPLDIRLAPFKLRDPSGVAPAEQVTPTWAAAATRIRNTPFGHDLEVFTELAWAVWLRLVIGLREDRIDILAQVHVDMPRRIGNLEYDPHGLLLEFRGRPGRAFYDVPYATIEHTNPELSFVAAQRFVAMDSEATSFALVAIDGNQSFQLGAKEGLLAANLGASLQGRADKRPECIIRPNGYAEHHITSGGDPLLGSYDHRFAVVFQRPEAAAVTAQNLRTTTPLFHVEPGNGDWPTQQTLLPIEGKNVRITAFRATRDGCCIAVNNLSGAPSSVQYQGKSITLPGFGIATVRVDDA
jgi:hypothetical protein